MPCLSNLPLLVFVIHYVLSASLIVAPEIIVDVKAPWQETSLLHESILYARERNQFWSFLAESSSRILHTANDVANDHRSHYLHAQEVMSHILPNNERHLFEAALSTRFFLPKVEGCRKAVKKRIHPISNFFKHAGISWGSPFLEIRVNQTVWIAETSEKAEAFLKFRNFAILSEIPKENDIEIGSVEKHTENACLFSWRDTSPLQAKTDGTVHLTLFGLMGKLATARIHNSVLVELSKNSADLQYSYCEISNGCIGKVEGEDEMKCSGIGLSGYDVSFIVKSTEYIAHDEKRSPAESTTGDGDLFATTGVNFSILKRRYPGASSRLELIEASLASAHRTENSIDPAQVRLMDSDISTFGQKASVFIIRSLSPTQKMEAIAQNLPRLSQEINALKLAMNNRRVVQAIARSQQENNLFYQGEASLIVHGRIISVTDTDIFALTQALFTDLILFQSTRSVIDHCIPIHAQKIRHRLLEIFLCDKSDESSEKRTPIQRLHLPTGDIHWLNDLENDEVYASFPDDPNRLYTSPFPIPLRKNLFSLVIVIDPSRKSSLKVLLDTFQKYHELVGIRVGVFFVNADRLTMTRDSVAYKIAAIYKILIVEKRPVAGVVFLSRLLHYSVDERITESAVEDVLQALFHIGLNDLMNSPRDVCLLSPVEIALERAQMNQIDEIAPACFLNGARVSFTEDPQHVYFKEVELIRPLVVSGYLTHSTVDCYTKVIEAFHGIERYHPIYWQASENLSGPDLMKLSQMMGNFLWFSRLAQCDDDGVAKVSFVFLLDISARDSLKDFLEALLYIKSCAVPSERFAFLVHSANFPLHRLVVNLLRGAIKLHDTEILHEAVKVAIKIYEKSCHDQEEAIISFFRKHDENIPVALESPCEYSFVGTAIHWPTGSSVVLVNEKIIRLTEFVQSGHSLTCTDYQTISRESRQRMQWVTQAICTLDITKIGGTCVSNAIAIAAGLRYVDMEINGKRIGSMPHATEDSLDGFPLRLRDSVSKFPLFTETNYSVSAIVDPLSIHASKTISLLQFLQGITGCVASVYLNPTQELATRPILHFTKHFIPRKFRFSPCGQIVQPSCHFSMLPGNLLLSLTLRAPESWAIFPQLAPIDLDNIRLAEENNSPIRISYGLHGLVLQGRCPEVADRFPPAQLTLKLEGVHEEKKNTSETFVLGNFGYFQLYLLPGFSTLSVNRNETGYSILGASSTERESLHVSRTDATGKLLLFHGSFAATNLVIDVTKLPFGNPIPVLEVTPQTSSTPTSDLSTFQRLLSSVWHRNTPAATNQTVHIFSIASGHLYERLLRLMMFRVTATTKAHVKFWFIEDFLSPRFKRLLPHFAEKFHCSYELVSYKWPKWLRKQINKQRTIWAYKVLFLDVLFPPTVDRIIFVDADQIVQSDIAELYNTDLHGKAVAYVPLCVNNSRNSTMGYRFWNSGHWKEHLRGKPYHISAIFLVDLKKFREDGAGDIYRSAYESLSADPQNLANLDQDLPNYLQDIVPIHSLPEEWLWCESWCDDKSLRKAKTIDLCNNPLTKESKLVVAKRVIPRWEEWDNELIDYEEAILNDESVHGK